MHARLPEARLDELRRLRWIFATLAISVLPHLMHLPLWTVASLLVFGGWRYAHTRFDWRLIPRIPLLIIAFLHVLGVLATYRTVNGVDAGTALMVVMVSMKLMETRGTRDFILLIFISYFLVISAFLYTQAIPLAILMVPTVVVISTALLEVTRPPGRTMAFRDGVRRAGSMLLQALPLMIILFVLFPRIPGPLWGVPSRPSGVSGLDDSMSPGTISQLSLSTETAFRVSFDGSIPPRSRLYWRGPVLHSFDGRTWRRGENLDIDRTSFQGVGEPVNYTVTMEPTQRRWLYLLELPAGVPSAAKMSYDFQVRSDDPVAGLKRYQGRSYLDFRVDDAPTNYALLRDTHLSRTEINPRTRELGRRWAEELDSERAIVERALSHFRQNEFVYTLQPPALGASPTDEFLFETRRGFCEHYASAFTVLMRAAGIPARIVTGYQGGEENPFSGDLVIRQSDAHAWSEVWLGEEFGWTRVDPTGAVAPDRIELGLESALPEGEFLPGSLLRASDLMIYAQMQWEAINAVWDEFILGYGPDMQSALLTWFGLEDWGWEELVTLLVVTFGLAGALISWHLLRQLRRERYDAALQIYRRFLRKLERVEVERAASEGPRDFAERAATTLPDSAAAIRRITDLFIGLRYMPDPDEADIQVLRRAVRDFRL